MTNVRISGAAAKDLISIRDYIRNELNNPTAAVRIIRELKKAILSLADFPGRGRSLNTLIQVHTEYRYLVCGSYCIFYIFDTDSVTVVRILHQNRDYLKALFLQ